MWDPIKTLKAAPQKPLKPVCGSLEMLMTLFVMAFAVSGGLYLGTIVFSAYKFAEFDKAMELIRQVDFINLA